MTAFIIKHEGALSNEPAWTSSDVTASSEGEAIKKLEKRLGRKVGNFTIRERLSLDYGQESTKTFLVE